MLHHFTVVTAKYHPSDMKLHLQTSIYLGYVDKKSEWLIVIYHMLCLLWAGHVVWYSLQEQDNDLKEGHHTLSHGYV